MREIGSIDEHQHIGRRGHDRIDGLAHAPQEQRQLGDHGPEADRAIDPVPDKGLRGQLRSCVLRRRRETRPDAARQSDRMKRAPRSSAELSPATMNTSSGLSGILRGCCPVTAALASARPLEYRRRRARLHRPRCTISSRSAMIGAASLDRDAGKTSGDGGFDGASANRRQIEAAVLGRLRRLDENAAPGRKLESASRRNSRDARQHAVGTLRRLDCDHVIAGHHHGLADVERTGRPQAVPARLRCRRDRARWARVGRAGRQAPGFRARPRGRRPGGSP